MAYITTPIGIARFPHITKPDTDGKYADNKYKVNLVLTKDEIAEFKKKIVEMFGVTDKHKLPFGTDKKDENIVFLVTKNDKKPALFDKDKMELPVDTNVKIRSGAKLRLIVEAFPWKAAGNVGVSLKLMSVQIISLTEPVPEFDVIEDGYSYVPEDEDVNEIENDL